MQNGLRITSYFADLWLEDDILQPNFPNKTNLEKKKPNTTTAHLFPSGPLYHMHTWGFAVWSRTQCWGRWDAGPSSLRKHQVFIICTFSNQWQALPVRPQPASHSEYLSGTTFQQHENLILLPLIDWLTHWNTFTASVLCRRAYFQHVPFSLTRECRCGTVRSTGFYGFPGTKAY